MPISLFHSEKIDAMNDDELSAMQTVMNALVPLDLAAKQRVIDWVTARLELAPPRSPTNQIRKNAGATNTVSDGVREADYADFATLFTAAQPITETDKALLAAHWTQTSTGANEFTAKPVNDALKNLGHGASNIARTLTELCDSKPQLVLQLKKSGKTKQAKKTFRVTAEGRTAIKRLLEANGGAEER